MEEILNLLQNNARLALEDIAAMTKKTVEEVISAGIDLCTTWSYGVIVFNNQVMER